MKLYYSPGACSLAAHIALHEAGIMFELVKTSLGDHKLPDGGDYYAVAPKGQVPLLELDDGERLSEGVVILQYIGDHAPASGLVPPAGTMPRYRLMEWLNFVATELHKGFSPLFNPKMPAEAKTIFAKRLQQRFAYVDAQLAGRDYLTGERFCVADAYLYAMLVWAGNLGIDVAGLANLKAWQARVEQRPAVKAALRAEGLQA